MYFDEDDALKQSRQERTALENTQVAQQIDAILKNSREGQDSSEGDDIETAFSIFGEGKEVRSTLRLIRIVSPESVKDHWDVKVPADFTFPVFVFWDFSHRPDTTPYGVLPDKVISNGKLYFFDNYYLFSKAGEAAKCEEINSLSDRYPADMTLKEVLAEVEFNFSLDRERLVETDFPVSPDDSRFVPLGSEDREIIEAVLHQVESGEFIEPGNY